MVTRTHNCYLKELRVNSNIETYVQSLVLRKEFESISLDHRRAGETDYKEITENTRNLEIGPIRGDKRK